MATAKKKTTTAASKGKPAAKKTPAPKKATPKKAPSKKAPAKKSTAIEGFKAAPKSSKVAMTPKQLDAAISDLAAAIAKDFPDPQGLVLLGIRTRGVFLAERVKALLEKKYKTSVAMGILDITFYRDDLSRLGPNPMVRGSDLPFDIHDANIVLIDDVLYTGRTVRAALDEISDFGRPAVVRLAILVDRGLRELPIHPDYCGLSAKTLQTQRVRVCLEETDDEDKVVIDSFV